MHCESIITTTYWADRIKNETEAVKQQVIALNVAEGKPQEVKSRNGRLVVSYSSSRAKKDERNREKGLKRLQTKIKNGKLSKEHINNRGYNKYLKLEGDTKVSIDYQKYNADRVWDGLKGYVTNTSLGKEEIITQYSQLWQIEKAFRISKTDLRIRPVFHRLKNRVEAHICLCFAAYTVYKELERLLIVNQIKLSPEKAINEIKEIKQLKYTLPKSKETKTKILKPSQEQEWLLNMQF